MNIFKPLPNYNLREFVETVYLDWCNNYASVVTFAEHLGIDPVQARKLIELFEEIHESPHTER